MSSAGKCFRFLLWTLLSGGLVSVVPVCLGAGSPSPEHEVRDVARLARRLGPRLAAHMTEHFLMISGEGEPWMVETGRLLEDTHDRFFRSFEKAGFRPGRLRGRLTWVVFNDHDEFDDYAFEADHMDMSWLDGYYSARTNRVAVVRLGGSATRREAEGHTASIELMYAGLPAGSDIGSGADSAGGGLDVAKVTHEAAHQLAFNSGLQKRGVMYPLWVSEGIATYIESDGSGAVNCPRATFHRRGRLLEAGEHRRLIPLQDFVSMTRAPAEDDDLGSAALYAQACGLFRFLIEQRPEQLRTYLAALERLSPGRREVAALRHEFIAAFGAIGPIEESWTHFLRSIARPTPSISLPSIRLVDMGWLLFEAR